MGLLLQADALDGLGGAKAFIELAPINDVLKFDLIKGAALPWFDRITLYRNPERVLVLDNISLADFIAVHFHMRCLALSREFAPL